MLVTIQQTMQCLVRISLEIQKCIVFVIDVLIWESFGPLKMSAASETLRNPHTEHKFISDFEHERVKFFTMAE